MKTFVLSLFVGLFMAVSGVSPVMAQDAGKSPNIAIVDVQALLRDSKAANSIESQLETLRKDFQSEVEKEEKKLRDAEKAILEQKSKLSEDEFKAKVGEFQKKVTEGQKKIQERKAKLDKAVATAVGKLRSEIVKIVAELGESRKYDLVLSRTDVVIVSKDLDVTQDVMEKLNSGLSSVKVTIE